MQQYIKKILLYFVISRGYILFIALASLQIIEKGIWFSRPKNVINSFFLWDSAWYMSIVKNGYSFIENSQSNVNFFPLYPLAVKILSFSGLIDPFFTGIFISNIALIFSCVYLHKLIMIDCPDEKIARKSVFFLLVCPASFFFSIFYTEGIFLFFSIGAFYYARRKNWLLTGIFGFFCALSKSVGFLIFFPLLLEYFLDEDGNFKFRLKKDVLYLIAIPAGLLSYVAYLYIKFKDGFAFLKASSAGWGVKLSSLFETINVGNYQNFYKIIFLLAVISSLFIVLYLISTKTRKSYIAYCLVFLFFYLSAGKLDSIVRYISVLFPLYIGLSIIANKNEAANSFFALFSAGLLGLFTILFVNGYWFV